MAWEVLMRKSRSRPKGTQFELFRPWSKSPLMRELPREVREKTARRLREHSGRVLVSGRGKEARDE